ncbi:MAG: hypothetical protein AYP45_15755 [Candidatus Brocadia carolinensis]|uniref:Uncharacterized protein n=1 Tax=Candidatus Brocadia carolinensis TaxID=1004156 RepID=A0A1V4AQ66_9BACT|nr:MAG: hypothetical protein AYP45_15755 [Candidatus Brocadia caroliniensis]
MIVGDCFGKDPRDETGDALMTYGTLSLQAKQSFSHSAAKPQLSPAFCANCEKVLRVIGQGKITRMQDARIVRYNGMSETKLENFIKKRGGGYRKSHNQ